MKKVPSCVDIAQEFETILDSISIAELKYRVTDRFFKKIEEYFWEPHLENEHLELISWQSKITDRKDISDEIFSFLKEYQNEIRFYLGVWKKLEYNNHTKLTNYYAETNRTNDLKRTLLRYLDKNNESLISIKDVFFSNISNKDPIELTGQHLTALEEICEFTRTDYMLLGRSWLIKKDALEKSTRELKPNMTINETNETLFKLGISNETAIKYVLILLGYKTIKDVNTKQKVIIKKT